MKYLRMFICSVLLLAAMQVMAAEKTRPNILVVLTDDVGWGDFACYNPQSKLATPNVDRLAREGM